MHNILGCFVALANPLLCFVIDKILLNQTFAVIVFYFVAEAAMSLLFFLHSFCLLFH